MTTPDDGHSNSQSHTQPNFPLTLLYDGACPVCNLEMDNLKARNTAGLLKFVDISVPFSGLDRMKMHGVLILAIFGFIWQWQIVRSSETRLVTAADARSLLAIRSHFFLLESRVYYRVCCLILLLLSISFLLFFLL